MASISTVVILGAGAMGSLFAARFAQAGAQVTLVDVDPKRIELINAQGLQLEDDAGVSHVDLHASLASDVSGPVDLVLLFTKGMHSRSAAQSLAHLARGDTIALTLQNGVGNAEVLAEVFGADKVLMGTAHVPADMAPPNRVISHGFAHVHLGGFSAAAQDHAQPVADLLRAARFDPVVTDKAEAAVWDKLAFNAALNAIATVAEANNGQMNNEPALRIARAVVSETVAVAAARGMVLDEAHIHETVARALADHPGHEASMLQDRKAGRPTEVESITGAVARLGVDLGVPTPVTATLADLVRVIELKRSAG